MSMTNPGGSGGETRPSNPSIAPVYETPSSPNTYVVSSKIVVVAVAVLFVVVLFMLCLHIYAKWFWRSQGFIVAPAGGRSVSWRRGRRGQAGLHDQTPSEPLFVLQSVGLERSVVESLPTFVYKAEEMKDGLECAVCLEEFEENESGRTLPKCGHNFHLDCVDMWLHSHSTCPLCRTSVRPDEEKSVAMVVMPAPISDAVVGDVEAPFMSAMRASRRSRGLGVSLSNASSPTGTNPVSATLDSTHEGELESNSASTHRQGTVPEGTLTTATAEQKVVTKSILIPSNVLFWGNDTQMSTSTQSSAGARSGLGAPFQVAVDIPRGQSIGNGESSSPFSNLRSPMSRPLASFRRLLSRGKSVAVSPQEDGEEGAPSTPSPPSSSVWLWTPTISFIFKNFHRVVTLDRPRPAPRHKTLASRRVVTRPYRIWDENRSFEWVRACGWNSMFHEHSVVDFFLQVGSMRSFLSHVEDVYLFSSLKGSRIGGVNWAVVEAFGTHIWRRWYTTTVLPAWCRATQNGM